MKKNSSHVRRFARDVGLRLVVTALFLWNSICGACAADASKPLNGLSFAAMNASTDAKIPSRVIQLVEGETLMLFDTVADPSERTNLSNDPQTVAFQLAISK